MNALPLKTIPVLRVLMMVRNVSSAELGRHVGVSGTYVNNWLHGKYEPNEEQALKTAEYLRIPLSDFWDEEEAPEKKVGKLKRVAEDHVVKHLAAEADRALPDQYEVHPDLHLLDSIAPADGRIAIPIWQESVAASDFASNDASQDQELAWVPAPMARHHGAKLRAIKCAGRSMVKDGLTPGAVLLVRKTSDAKRCQGKIVIAAQDGGMTVKRLVGNRLEPNSDESYPTLILGDDATLQGEVVGVYRPPRPKDH